MSQTAPEGGAFMSYDESTLFARLTRPNVQYGSTWNILLDTNINNVLFEPPINSYDDLIAHIETMRLAMAAIPLPPLRDGEYLSMHYKWNGSVAEVSSIGPGGIGMFPASTAVERGNFFDLRGWFFQMKRSVSRMPTKIGIAPFFSYLKFPACLHTNSNRPPSSTAPGEIIVECIKSRITGTVTEPLGSGRFYHVENFGSYWEIEVSPPDMNFLQPEDYERIGYRAGTGSRFYLNATVEGLLVAGGYPIPAAPEAAPCCDLSPIG